MSDYAVVQDCNVVLGFKGFTRMASLPFPDKAKACAFADHINETIASALAEDGVAHVLAQHRPHGLFLMINGRLLTRMERKYKDVAQKIKKIICEMVNVNNSEKVMLGSVLENAVFSEIE